MLRGARSCYRAGSLSGKLRQGGDLHASTRQHHHCQHRSWTRFFSDRGKNRGVLHFISQERIFVRNVGQTIDVPLLHREGLPSCASATQSGTVRARAHASDRRGICEVLHFISPGVFQYKSWRCAFAGPIRGYMFAVSRTWNC